MEILVLLVVLVAAYWAKNNLLKPDTSQMLDDLFLGGVNFVKKSINSPSDNKIENVVDEKERQVAVATVVTMDKEPLSPAKVPQNVVAAVEEAINDYAAIESAEIAVKRVPEDSVLKRHYQAQLIAERTSISHPYPTDSVLRRHYENNIQIAFNPALTDQTAHIAPQLVIDPISSKVTQVFPEDSVLKRHFAQLIEAKAAA